MAKARALLVAIGRFPDGPILVARCLLICNLLAFIPQAVDIRAALNRLIGTPMSHDFRRLASLEIASGGLGARSAAEQAPAAYGASCLCLPRSLHPAVGLPSTPSPRSQRMWSLGCGGGLSPGICSLRGRM